MNEIKQALTRIFQNKRIVFWYDVKQELKAEYDSLTLPDVEKITLGNNQFGVKHRILREQPAQKFLLYHDGPPPADLDNWLLDIELAHGSFRADQISLWLHELGLSIEFTDVVAPHADFFQVKRRREQLKAALLADDTPGQIRLKMLAVAAGAEPRPDDIVENLLAELAADKNDKISLIEQCALDEFLWQQLERKYGYTSTTPGSRDFAIELFKSCYAIGLGEAAHLNNDALVFLKRWKDSVRHQDSFRSLSQAYAPILGIEQDVAQREYQLLLDLDLFELIDRKIVSDLVQAVARRIITADTCAQIIRQRRNSYWYETYQNIYEAIGIAAEFFQTLDQVDLTIRSFVDGVEQYGRFWYRLDQLYRQFVYHLQQSGQPTLLAPVAEPVENLYSNNFLLKLNNQWQAQVDACQQWDTAAVNRQQDFFENYVEPFLQRDNKVFVIISDALRYECGEELLRLIRQEDRYEAQLETAVTLLPSFTQLGMAALLPHQTLTLNENGSVLVNDQSSQGTENRKKILDQALPGRATALRAKDLLTMTREDSRALFREHEVVYIYHNQIDATGDKLETEERVFTAVEDAFNELILIIKKLANANVSNMLVTADHGFIYQNRPLEESDFAGQEPTGTEITVRNRRFVLGKGLMPTSSFKHFTAQAVGLLGTEMLIPKSINRLRVRGAGSRYVHGGASLQEIVVPVLSINKKRQSDVSTVNVDILRGATTIITSGQQTINFYQTEPVTEKLQPRRLRAGIYTQGGELISDQHELTFDMTFDDPRQRELPVRFILTSKADDANGQEVILRLEEQVADTSHYQEYKAARYLLRRSFTSDFDF